MDIWPYHFKYLYLAFRALEMCGVMSPKVLKTDCWNEALAPPHLQIANVIRPYCSEVVILELDPELAAKVPGAIVGDIRDLTRFSDEEFDIVMDFSTLDHVHEYKKVLDGYKRILKSGGILVLVVWTAEKLVYDHQQIYFNREDFFLDVMLRFGIHKEEEVDPGYSHAGSLILYFCRRM